MRLKKIAIYGFKSFAERTTLYFEQGVTCIVGPNGCGKSNIADAFLWVLGEQSAKSLRGSKMPDVIFAGAGARKPVNYAEVTLTLTDIQGKLPIEYDEMTLTRRLHRNGDSEYLINGNQVRLKDVQGIFFDSGLSHQLFSSFQQGELDRIISASPILRRPLFEEAAGIVRFQHRKKDAMKRLEQADINLARVLDIYKEVENQSRQLKVQAERAIRYKDKQGQLKKYEWACYILKARELSRKQESVNSKLAEREEQNEKARKQLSELDESILLIKNQVQQIEASLKTTQEYYYKERSHKEILQQEISSFQKRIQDIMIREKKINQELDSLEAARQARLKSIEDFSLREDSVESEYQGMAGSIQVRKDDLKTKDLHLRELREKLRSIHRLHMEQMEKEKRISSELNQREAGLESFKERIRQNEMRQEVLKDLSEKNELTLQERKAHLQQISSLIDSHRDKLNGIQEELKHLRDDSERFREGKESLQQKFLYAGTRHKLLIKMRDDLEGFSSGSKKLLQEAKNPKSRFFNKLRPIFDYLSLDPESEQFIQLKPLYHHYEQTLVVHSLVHFQEILEWSEKEEIGDFALLCLEHVFGSEMKDFTEEAISKLISEHFFRFAALIDNAAIENGKEQWFKNAGFMDLRGVYFHKKLSDIQPFLREVELKDLDKEILSLKQEIVIVEEKHQLAEQRKNELQFKRHELDQIFRRDEMKLVEVNFGVQQAIKDKEKYKTESDKIDHDRKGVEQQMIALEKGMGQFRSELDEVKKSLVSLNHNREGLQSDIDREDALLRIHLETFQADEIKFQQLSKDHQQLKHQLNLLESKERDHSQLVQRYLDELQEGVVLKEGYEQKILLLQQALEEAIAKMEEWSAKSSDAEVVKEGLKEDLAQREKECITLKERFRKVEEEIIECKIQLNHFAEMKCALDEGWREGETPLESHQEQELPLKEGLESIEKQIRSIKAFLDKEADVNLASIDELAQLQVRIEFLTRQTADLEKSKNELVQVIKELELQCRKLFKTTFEQIRINFKKNFQILFSGGDADLEFSESSDPLEAGIEISAKPPGKQMRSISLLSGGEKCLTAVALLFAIFEVKPAPFCILDEIDAPLDDANVQRFLNVVRHFCDRCQFLIITHNKRTMAISDKIFGVSMEEKGVSKLLSLSFNPEREASLTMV